MVAVIAAMAAPWPGGAGSGAPARPGPAEVSGAPTTAGGREPTAIPAPAQIPVVAHQADWVPAAAYSTLPASLPLSSSRPTVALFGDSLALQAYKNAAAIAGHRGYRLVGGAFGGLALCDTLRSLTAVLASERPAVVVLGFAGNAITPCMRPDGRAPSVPAIAARYIRDARAVITQARRQGTDVWLVTPPRMRPRDRDAAAVALTRAWRLLGREPGVRVIESGPFLSPAGFAVRLPCLPFETRAVGCRQGTIAVRGDDGVHLAAPGVDPAYSSGALRYAEALTGYLPPR